MLLIALTAACGPVTIDQPTEEGAVPTGETGTADTADTTDTSATDTADTADTGEAPDPVTDCDNLPSLPIDYEVLSGFSTAEDFTFDGEGNLIAVRSGSLVKYSDSSDFEIIAPGYGEMAGTSILANGDYILANPTNGTVVRVTPEGGQTVILSGVNYPNGVTVGTDGYVYVSGHTFGDIYQVDPDTGDYVIITPGIDGANGMSFSPDGQTLYVCSFTDGTVWAIDRDGEGWSEKRLLGRMPGGWSGLDGLNVDECGNVYVTEYVEGIVWKIDPTAKKFEPQEVASLPSYWIPNLHWGRGIGEFDDDLLYVADREQGRLFALDVGAKSTPQGFDAKK